MTLDNLRVLMPSWLKVILSLVKEAKKKKKTLTEKFYTATCLIQFKTAAKNTVLHRYPKDLYFIHLSTVYGLAEILIFSFEKNKMVTCI